MPCSNNCHEHSQHIIVEQLHVHSAAKLSMVTVEDVLKQARACRGA